MIDTCSARPRFRAVLIIDAVINAVLGILLMIFPDDLVSWLGLPITYEPFYTSVLGAVLIGIAIALVVECVRKPAVLGGLGLGGAVAINICGACAIMLWLVSGRLIIPLRGYLMLWILVFILLIVSGIEVIVCESASVKHERDIQEEGKLQQQGESEREP